VNSSELNTEYIPGDATPDTFLDNPYWMDGPENANTTDPDILVPHLIHHLNPDTRIVVICRFHGHVTAYTKLSWRIFCREKISHGFFSHKTTEL
jgi:hypothetical protein